MTTGHSLGLKPDCVTPGYLALFHKRERVATAQASALEVIIA
jgi:hypothetical protein